jgi:hypothetical protein
MDHNIHRRHLSSSQRALIAAKLANLRRGQRADLTNKNREAGIPACSQREAARFLNVSGDSVQQATKVLKEGTSEEIRAVETGLAARCGRVCGSR